MGDHLNLHLFQWEVAPGNVGKNLEKAEDLLAATDIGQKDLVILPEMFPSGFSYEALDRISGQSDAVVEWMSDRARQSGIAVAGSLPTRLGGGVGNSLFLVNPGGEVAGRYDKIHLFPGTGEDRFFVAGDRAVTAVSGGLKIGLAICFDLRFPELCRRLCLEGAQIMVVCSQWPMSRIDHFRDLVRVRAMENQMFVAACNSCGNDGSGLSLGGGSRVSDPSGTIKGALGTKEGVLTVKIDIKEIRRVREQFPVLKCRRGDIFGDG